MPTYVMSDIHGEKDRFDRMLEKISFSAADTLYILGDVIDRGPHGVELLQKIIRSTNMHMLLGNHEDMCLKYHSPRASFDDVRRWNLNGNYPTLCALERLRQKQMDELLFFLYDLPTHFEVEVNGRKFYLVHAFPGEHAYDEVWRRPTPDTPNPRPEYRVILGHTPVLSLGRTGGERLSYLQELEAAGDHLHIWHGENFIDIDCGCGHEISVKVLACLRLEDMAEFYV